MSGAFGAITTQLSGGASPLPPLDSATRQRQAAALLQRVAAEMKAIGGPDFLQVAAVFESHLDGGGTLDRLFGLTGTRGGRWEKPHSQLKRERQLAALQDLALGGGATPAAQGRSVSSKLIECSAEVLSLLASHGLRPDELPTSAVHIADLLRRARAKSDSVRLHMPAAIWET